MSWIRLASSAASINHLWPNPIPVIVGLSASRTQSQILYRTRLPNTISYPHQALLTTLYGATWPVLSSNGSHPLCTIRKILTKRLRDTRTRMVSPFRVCSSAEEPINDESKNLTKTHIFRVVGKSCRARLRIMRESTWRWRMKFFTPNLETSGTTTSLPFAEDYDWRTNYEFLRLYDR